MKSSVYRLVNRATTGAALALGLVLATGCESFVSRDTLIRADLTPELRTNYQRPVDVDNQTALVFDTNARMFMQDLARAFYWDRPSRLTPEPIPH